MLCNAAFGFDRLATKGGKAIFKVGNCAGLELAEVMQAVSGSVAVSSIELPGYLVCFECTANDTEVPGLRVNEKLGEIRFDWRAMFSHFLAEEKLKVKFETYKEEVGGSF